jgi:dephospho-CoA kinase
MPKLIIGLVGSIASGKETAKKYICQKYDAKSYKFSSVLRDILKRLYLPVNRKNLQNISFDLRKRFGEDILAKTIAEDVKKDNSSIIVIDGARRLEDIRYLKPLPEFKLISITADIKIRYQRLLQRNENTDDKQKTFAEFQKDCNQEAEKEIPKVTAASDYRINNNHDFNRLYQQIEEIISKINAYGK